MFALRNRMKTNQQIHTHTKDRLNVRSTHERSSIPFVEIYVKAPLELCEKRDVKGFYKKARSGPIKDFPGIDSSYEAPVNPELTLDTEKLSIDECVRTIVDYLHKHVLIQD